MFLFFAQTKLNQKGEDSPLSQVREQQIGFYGDEIILLFQSRNNLQIYTKCLLSFSTQNMKDFNCLENHQV